MDFFLNAGSWNSLFAVPVDVVDKYIKLASGSAVKVLLYLLRNSGKNISCSEISSAINISEDDVCDAFNFWKEVGILNQGNETVTNTVQSTQTKAQKVPETSAAKKTVTAAEATKKQSDTVMPDKPQVSSGNYNITPKEIEKMKENSKEIKDMIDMAQQTTGDMISPGLLKSLIWQHEYLGLKIGVILMLLSYCSSVGKAGVGYIEAIAINWSQNDINTLDQAQNEIERMANSNNYYNKAAIAFGLKRHPTPNQKKFFEEWYRKGYSIELIECACERVADLGKTMTANYINGILENWHKKGIKTRKEAEDENKGRGKSVKKEQSYNISEFEKFAVTFSGNTKNQNN